MSNPDDIHNPCDQEIAELRKELSAQTARVAELEDHLAAALRTIELEKRRAEGLEKKLESSQNQWFKYQEKWKAAEDALAKLRGKS